MVTGAYNPHTFKVRRDGIGKQTNKNDFDFNQGKNGKKKKTERKEKQEHMKTERCFKKKFK